MWLVLLLVSRCWLPSAVSGSVFNPAIGTGLWIAKAVTKGGFSLRAWYFTSCPKCWCCTEHRSIHCRKAARALRLSRLALKVQQSTLTRTLIVSGVNRFGIPIRYAMRLSLSRWVESVVFTMVLHLSKWQGAEIGDA